MVWSFYSQLYYGGFFVHQWDVRFRGLQKVLYVQYDLPFRVTCLIYSADFRGISLRFCILSLCNNHDIRENRNPIGMESVKFPSLL